MILTRVVTYLNKGLRKEEAWTLSGQVVYRLDRPLHKLSFLVHTFLQMFRSLHVWTWCCDQWSVDNGPVGFGDLEEKCQTFLERYNVSWYRSTSGKVYLLVENQGTWGGGGGGKKRL